jgi:hypothetical protein
LSHAVPPCFRNSYYVSHNWSTSLNYDTQSYNGLTRFWLAAFLLLPSYFQKRPFTKTTPGRLRQASGMWGLQPVTPLSMPFGAAYYSQSTFVCHYMGFSITRGEVLVNCFLVTWLLWLWPLTMPACGRHVASMWPACGQHVGIFWLLLGVMGSNQLCLGRYFRVFRQN